ncbi:hypothetical protein C7B65_04215 [Phormidesmis priestleyi ULC007]|uniref:Uncharacterized protein n=1 Tax=Phormidesmis priestleyi ULC007 TaxID=1920490 RepID=A0A2T1DL24_9CYAN|nr:hypothetical protein [Phormidesmis priestleyi]PSB21151.1 hypothetical protein C7B65_04215 [Phormidesmis priestleyi ULC007]PZO51324.1 MAG: hypothetical protein DCF14_09495 [Phormidesmis priestleyi]
MTQSNDLSQRVDRTESQIVDLQLTANLILQAIGKNSEDIAVLIEVSRRNSEGIAALRDGTAALQRSQLRTEAGLQVFQQHTDAAIERIDAAIERIDASIGRIDVSIERLTASDGRTEQLLEYLIRRDRGQLE